MKETKFKLNKILTLAIAYVLVCTIAISLIFSQKLFTKNEKTVENETVAALNTPENLRARNYARVEDETYNTNTEYVKFAAFFTRDLDGDGYAEKLAGTCKEVSGTDELFIEFNVLTSGYLKDGEITIENANFDWKTAILSDTMVDGNYIGNTSSIKLKDRIDNGSQKLLWGTITSNIGNNINNYTKTAIVRLTGTHVAEDGTETLINETRELIVDWYGSVGAKFVKTSFTKNVKDIYFSDTSIKLSASVTVKDPIQKLLLKSNTTTFIIPQLNGYNPTRVTAEGSYTYNSTSRKLTITKNSTVNAQGDITKSLLSSNTYTIYIEYPLEAYEQGQSFSIKIPVESYYTAYNNKMSEFGSPKQSNVASDIIILNYTTEETGYIYKFDIKVGEYVSGRYLGDVYIPSRYAVSKAKPLQIYNGIAEKTVDDYYTVRWEFFRGTLGEVEKVVIKEGENCYDEFLNTSSTKLSMLQYADAKNIGIYFTGATETFGENGYINVFDDETNELIHKFTVEDWGKYNQSNPYKYDTARTHIRIEASASNKSSSFNVYNVKEIDDETVTTKLTKEEFDALIKIYSNLKGTVTIAGIDEESTEIGSANYENLMSYASIETSKEQIATTETANNFKIYIDTIQKVWTDSKWKNGQFIVKVPDEINSININSITVNKSNVEIIGYDVYEENGSYFIKIITNNDEENIYKITIDCDITPDPTTPVATRKFELYAYNPITHEYGSLEADIYDVNGNNNKTEKVGYSEKRLSFITPSSLVTTQYITNYNEANETTIAPNVADVELSQRTAKLNISVRNNYSRTISDVKLIGMIPFENNKYLINGGDLGSQFTTQMNNTGIQVPNELKDKVKVYYSENAKPTQDLNNTNNKWTTTPSDWSKVRTYLIDFQDTVLSVNDLYVFTYDITLPTGLSYNQVSYTDHAVYFALDTDGGKLLTQTEPNKVGIRIARKYSLDLTKLKKNTSRGVLGATYKITNKDDSSDVRLATTLQNGRAAINNLRVDVTYKLEEIVSPDDYELNTNVIEFNVVEQTSGTLKMNITSENGFKTTPTINGNKITAQVEDIPKYKLVINKTDKASGAKLKNVKFKLTENGKYYVTDANGQLSIDGLSLGQTYHITEIRADGYYIDSEAKTITVNYSGNSLVGSGTLGSVSITNNASQDAAIATVNIKNEKIPTYKLQLLKVEENDEETLTPLANAIFSITSQDLATNKEYRTDSNGLVEIPDLYQYVEGKYITGNYTLQEIKAPSGYSNCAENIEFKISKNNGTLEATINNQSSLNSLKEVKVVSNDTIQFIMKDKPLFTLTKTDENGQPLDNVSFVIYKVNEDGTNDDYAKDINGNYVGTRISDGKYIVKTNDRGVISLPLEAGTYRAVEYVYPEGYGASIGENMFKIIGEELTEPNNLVEINCIQDLVKLSNSVNNGTFVSGTTVRLMRDLDFTKEESYKDANNSNRNSTETTYGDINGNGRIEGIMQELTNTEDGHGFIPIGTYENKFQR